MASEPIVLLRLVSGEEIIAKKSAGRYKNCAILVPNGQSSLGIMPWMPYVEDTKNKEGLHIKDSFIAFETAPVVELQNEYNKLFGSGILMPTLGEKASLLKG